MTCLKTCASLLLLVASARASSSHDSGDLVQMSPITSDVMEIQLSKEDVSTMDSDDAFDVIDWVWSIFLIGTWIYLVYYCVSSVLSLRSLVSFCSKGRSKCTMLFKLAGSIAPIVYVFSLPWLAKVGFAYPYTDNDEVGHSMSRYICTPVATGVFAGAMFYPLKEFWEPYQKDERFGSGYRSLLATTIAIFLFIISPVITYPRLHAIATLSFCLACGFHIRHMQNNLPETLGEGHCNVLQAILSCGFMIFLCLLGCTTYQDCRLAEILDPQEYPALGSMWSNYYYYLESLGLTCLCLWSAFRDFFKDVTLIAEEEKAAEEEKKASGEGADGSEEGASTWFGLIYKIIWWVIVGTLLAIVAFALLILCAVIVGYMSG